MKYEALDPKKTVTKIDLITKQLHAKISCGCCGSCWIPVRREKHDGVPVLMPFGYCVYGGPYDGYIADQDAPPWWDHAFRQESTTSSEESTTQESTQKRIITLEELNNSGLVPQEGTNESNGSTS